MMMKSIITGLIILVLAVGILSVSAGLDFANPGYSDMDGYITEHGQEETGANNIVTGVVFDFRGFDTLGEATVLFTAVLGVGLAFRMRKEDEDYDYE